VELCDYCDQALSTTDTDANVVMIAQCNGVAFATGTIVIVNRIHALTSSVICAALLISKA